MKGGIFPLMFGRILMDQRVKITPRRILCKFVTFNILSVFQYLNVNGQRAWQLPLRHVSEPQRALTQTSTFSKGARDNETRCELLGSLCNCNQFGVFVATAFTTFWCAPLALPWMARTTQATSCGERLHFWLSNRKRANVSFFSLLAELNPKPQCIERVYRLLLGRGRKCSFLAKSLRSPLSPPEGSVRPPIRDVSPLLLFWTQTVKIMLHVGWVVAFCMKCDLSPTEELSDVSLTSDHEKTDDVIATRVAQPRLSFFLHIIEGDRACHRDPSMCNSESQREECATACHQVVLARQDFLPLEQQPRHLDTTGYTGATCLQTLWYLVRY